MCLKNKRNYIRYCDIFAPPYRQKINSDHYEKKTTMGGVFSLLVIIGSLSYFFYLVTIFFQNKIAANYNSYEQYNFGHIEFPIKSDQIIFEIAYTEDKTITQLQVEQKKQYFDISLIQMDDNKQKQKEIFSSLFQFNQSLISSFDGYDPQSLVVKDCDYPFFESNLQIKIQKCSGNHLMDETFQCASDQEFNEVINKIVLIILAINDTTFSIQDNKEQRRSFIKFLVRNQSDEKLEQLLIIKLQQTQVSQGFFLQNNEVYNQVYDIKQKNLFHDTIQNEDFASIFICLDHTVRFNQIQYPLFSEILAQAWSTISLVLLSGYLIQFIAQSSLAQDFLAIQLKYYYKKTAQKLFNQKQKLPSPPENSNEDKDNNSDDSSINLQNQVQNIIKKNEEIKSASFKKNFKKYFKMSEYEKWKIFFFPKYCLKRRKKITQESQTNQEMSAFEMQKELLKIKTVLNLILTPRQYSAIQMCGCDLIHPTEDGFIPQLKENKQESQKEIELSDIDQIKQIKEGQNKAAQEAESQREKSNIFNDSNIIQPQPQYTLNHLEIMNRVDIDPIYKQICLENFLKADRFNNDVKNQTLNNRIKNCMMGLNQEPKNKPFQLNQSQ